MKKLMLKFSIFALIIALGIVICDWGYLRADPYNTDKFKNAPDEIDICNLGASHSLYGFNYSDYADQYKTSNFGLDSQSHQYDYIILNHYKDRIKKGGIVFLVISYPMIVGVDEIEKDDFESMNKRYYTFLPAEEIREYNLKTDLEMKFIPFVNAATLRGLASSFFTGKKSNYWARQTTAKEAALDATKAAMRHVGEKSDANGQIRYNEGAINAIYKIIETCKQIEATPVLITTPFTNEYLSEIKRLAPEYYEHGFSDCVHKIQEDTGVAYYDYSRDERFKKDYSIFLNSDHLNEEGARLFTDILMEDVVSKIKVL